MTFRTPNHRWREAEADYERSIGIPDREPIVDTRDALTDGGHMTSNDTPARALAVLAPTMSPADQVAEREELVAWLDRQIGDSECGVYWQRQLRRIRSLLTATLATTPAVPLGGVQEAVADENAQLRQILCDVLKALGNGSGASPSVSLEFLRSVPEGVRLEVAALRGASPHEGAAADAMDALQEQIAALKHPFHGDTDWARGYNEGFVSAKARATGLVAAMSAAPASGEKA